MPESHTDKQYESELKQIRENFSSMGQMVEKMMAKSFNAFFTHDMNLAYEVIRDDESVDQRENDINDLCVSVIARRQPLGPDLRFIMSIQKSIIDLERIADLCVNISERTVELYQAKEVLVNDDLKAMTGVVAEMFHDCLDLFFSDNIHKADDLINRDRIVDAYYAQIFRQVLESMRSDVKTFAQDSRLIVVIGSVERIGDHIKNISEQIIYMVEGRHTIHKKIHESRSRHSVRGILFLCVHNSARSQIAEGWSRAFFPDEIKIYSAGSLPATEVHPTAIQVMQEEGIDISSQHPKRLTDVPLGKIDMVVTLCAEEICVDLPGEVLRESWFFPDPSSEADKEEQKKVFRDIRDEIKEKICELKSRFTKEK